MPPVLLVPGWQGWADVELTLRDYQGSRQEVGCSSARGDQVSPVRSRAAARARVCALTSSQLGTRHSLSGKETGVFTQR